MKTCLLSPGSPIRSMRSLGAEEAQHLVPSLEHADTEKTKKMERVGEKKEKLTGSQGQSK